MYGQLDLGKGWGWPPAWQERPSPCAALRPPLARPDGLRALAGAGPTPARQRGGTRCTCPSAGISQKRCVPKSWPSLLLAAAAYYLPLLSAACASCPPRQQVNASADFDPAAYQDALARAALGKEQRFLQAATAQAPFAPTSLAGEGRFPADVHWAPRRGEVVDKVRPCASAPGTGPGCCNPRAPRMQGLKGKWLNE